MPISPLPVLQLLPEYRDYLWGGNRLKPPQSPIAEAWVVYEADQIASGPFSRRTLADMAAEYGANLLGEFAIQQTGTRFPLLIKLLDCAQWLSLQVHPNDEQAARLEGAGFFGKTEAWHVLDATPEARLIAGMKPGTTTETLANAIRNGTILDWVQYLAVQAGDTIFMQPGTIHALGPGLLIYEVQQTSDLTYRVFDWNRPQTGRRVLHIEKSLAVANPTATAPLFPLPALEDGSRLQLVKCPYFTLEMLAAQSQTLVLDTKGESFHALTVIDGAAQVTLEGESYRLKRFESVIIPASCRKYTLQPLGSLRMLKASVE